jgi:hypothetical protein
VTRVLYWVRLAAEIFCEKSLDMHISITERPTWKSGWRRIKFEHTFRNAQETSLHHAHYESIQMNYTPCKPYGDIIKKLMHMYTDGRFVAIVVISFVFIFNYYLSSLSILTFQ